MNHRVKGNTKIYGVIGDPIAHSLSPELHNTIFDRVNENSIYIPLRIEEKNLEESIPMLRNNLKGFNVTIPHKEKIIPYLDELDHRARWYGAVNTVKVEDGRLIGYNTDGYGFMKSLEAEGVDIKGKRVVVLGAGGAARVIAYEILDNGGYLTIANRSIEKAKKLKDDLCLRFDSKRIEVCSLDDIKEGYYCMVNATPIGMDSGKNQMPVNHQCLKGIEIVYDLIYNPYKTKLLSMAEEYGCKCINGFSMLFYQGVRAQEIWKDINFRWEILSPIYKDVEEYLK